MVHSFTCAHYESMTETRTDWYNCMIMSVGAIFANLWLFLIVFMTIVSVVRPYTASLNNVSHFLYRFSQIFLLLLHSRWSHFEVLE